MASRLKAIVPPACYGCRPSYFITCINFNNNEQFNWIYFKCCITAVLNIAYFGEKKLIYDYYNF